MNLRSDAIGTSSNSDSINPFEPLDVPPSNETLEQLVREIQFELRKREKWIRNDSTLGSSIFMVPGCDRENQLFLALVMYASRACNSPLTRSKSFDSLLLDLDAIKSPSSQQKIKNELISEHGDILERAQQLNRTMMFWSGTLVFSSLIMLSNTADLNLPKQLRDIIDTSIDPADYAACCWLKQGVGILGSAAGAWACISTWLKAEDPESLATKALEYVESLYK
jgi:hypothetical protein